jgi:NitT/TauT family transport system substrate-binding protein
MKRLVLFFFTWALLAPATGEPLQKLSVSYVPNLSFAQLFVIKQEGWDKEEGLDLNPLRFQDASAGLMAFSHGDVDILYTICPTLLAFVSKGIDAQMICAGSESIQDFYGQGELAALAQQMPLADAIHQLREKRKSPVHFLAFYRGNGTDIQLRYWLFRQPGLRPDDYEITNVAGQNQFLQAVLAANYDGVVFFEPLIQIARSKIPGLTLLITGQNMLPAFPSTVVAVSSKFARENPETVRKLVRLQIRATELIRKDPAKASEDAAVFMAAGLIPFEIVQKAMNNRLSNFQPNPHSVRASTQAVYDFMTKDGLIQKPFDLDHFFNTSFYDQVVAEVKK